MRTVSSVATIGILTTETEREKLYRQIYRLQDEIYRLEALISEIHQQLNEDTQDQQTKVLCKF